MGPQFLREDKILLCCRFIQPAMPSKQITITAAGRSAGELLQLAYGTLLHLGWTPRYTVDGTLIGYTPKSWNRYDNEITIQATDGRLEVTSAMVHGEMADLGKRTTKDVTAFEKAFAAVSQAASAAQLAGWQADLEQLHMQTLQAAEEQTRQAAEVDNVMHISGSNLYVTYGLIGINVLVYLAMVVSGVNFFEPTSMDVLKWGASLPALDLSGQWWRIFTSMFLHFGFIHIVMNMVALYMISIYMEPMLGKARWLTGYLCAGLIGGIVSLLLRKNELVVGAGASGAIFGTYGIFLALLTTKVIPQHIRGNLLRFVLFFVAYNVFYGFKKGSGIDNGAHLGGLAGGMIIGYIYYFSVRKPTLQSKAIACFTVIALTLVVCVAVFRQNKIERAVSVDYNTGKIQGWDSNDESKDPSNWTRLVQRFSDLEEQALAVVRDSVSSADVISKNLQNISLPAWREAAAVVDSLQLVAGDDLQKSQASIFQEYVQIRTEQTRVQIEYLSNPTEELRSQIGQMDQRIDTLLGKLSN